MFANEMKTAANDALVAELNAENPTAWSNFVDSHPGLVEGAASAGAAIGGGLLSLKRFGNGGVRPPKAPSQRNTGGGTFPNRDAAWDAASRDRADYRYAHTREECRPDACHVHLDIYNNKGELLETKHYRYPKV
jgi:hypothetical protein